MPAGDAPSPRVCCWGGGGGFSISSTHHLLNSMKSFPMKTKGLLKQDFIFHSPLIWEGGKVGQISQ